MEHRYHIGDRVIVRPDLKRGVDYYMENRRSSNSAVQEMIRLGGKVVTICGVSDQYTVKENAWSWTDEMFLGLESAFLDDGIDAYDTSRLLPFLSALCAVKPTEVM